MTEAIAQANVSESDWAFHFETGRSCLDFVATLAERGGDSFDRWRDAAALARWCAESGLLAAPPPLRHRQLEQARALREAIYRMIAAVRSGRLPRAGDIARVNAWAARPTLTPRLAADGCTVSWSAREPLAAALAAVARDAIELLSGAALARVRKCAESSCSVLFLDASRPGKRRWCAMSRCGNKAKKAAFRRRHRPQK